MIFEQYGTDIVGLRLGPAAKVCRNSNWPMDISKTGSAKTSSSMSSATVKLQKAATRTEEGVGRGT